MRTVIYPGSFDPLTNGHLDVVQRAAKLFDRVIVAVAKNDSKNPLFTLQERRTLTAACVKHLPNVEVDVFDGLLVDYVEARSAQAIIRGLRAVSDFEFEFQLALMNRKLNERIETIFMMPKDTYTFLSSRIVKEIARLGGDVSAFVPPKVEAALKARLAGRRKGKRAVLMALLINLRQLEERSTVRLEGRTYPGGTGIDARGRGDTGGDAVVNYDVTAEVMEKAVLVQGRIGLKLNCECVRCLKPFEYRLDLRDWACLMPLEGDEKAVVTNDCVDLTPQLREDILLGFPQHPLCKPECGGLARKPAARTKKLGGAGQTKQGFACLGRVKQIEI